MTKRQNPGTANSIAPTDYTGTQKQKKERGFKLQNKKLLPFFGKIPVSQITPAHIRKWQNSLMAYRDENDKPYSETYLRTINNQLSAIMNYAVRYYNLRENPCRKAGSIGKSHADEMQFWTTDEFKKFLEKISDKPQARAGFLILYYTGLRIGELLALEYGDIDFKGCTINVNKSYQHINGKDVVTPPKTPKSVRIVSIPEFLRDEIKNYTERLYGLHKHDRIFPYTKSFFEHEMIRGTKDGEVKRIRLHDIRHPYVKHTTKKYNSEKQKTQTTNLSADSLGFLFLLFILRLCP